MKLKLILLILPLIVVFATELICITNLSNDTINSKSKYLILDNNRKYDGRLYIFTNYNSCSSCIKELSSLIDKVNKNINLELVVFMSGILNSTLYEIKRKYNWSYEVVPDPLGVYFKEYNIDNNNRYILLDNDGYILNTGDFYDLVEHPSILNIKRELENIRTTIHQSKDINLRNETDFITESRYIHGLYSKLLDQYLIYNSKNNSLNIYDSIGFLKESINIPKFILLHNPSCIDMTWIEHDKVILLHLAGDNLKDMKYTNLFTTFNIKSYTFDKINLSNLDTLNTPVFVYANPITHGFVSVTNFRHFMKSKKLEDIKSLTLFDNNKLIKAETGKVMQEYFDYELRNAYIELVTFSNTNLFSLQGYSKTVQKIDLNGNVIDTIKLEFPSSFRTVNSGLSIDPKIIDWVNFIRKCSILRDFSYDLTKNNFLTIIRNEDIPLEVEDPFSPLCKRNYYMNIFDANGKLISDDFKLSEDFPTILYNQDNSIGILHTTDNKLQVKWYEFSPQN